MGMKCKDGTDWEIPDDFLLALRETYYNADEQLAKMAIWLSAPGNQNRPTKRGMGKFIANWMSKSGQLRPITKPVSIHRAEVVKIDKTKAKEWTALLKGMVGRVH